MVAIKKVLEYETGRVLEAKVNHNHDGCKIKHFIEEAGWTLRAFTNYRHDLNDYLDGTIERLPCYNGVLQKYNDLGRVTPCNCTNICPLQNRLVTYVGLTINFIYELRNMNLRVPLQQMVGSQMTNFFADKFLMMDREKESHMTLKTDELPSWIHLSKGRSRAIFRMKSLHMDMIFRDQQ